MNVILKRVEAVVDGDVLRPRLATVDEGDGSSECGECRPEFFLTDAASLLGSQVCFAVLLHANHRKLKVAEFAFVCVRRLVGAIAEKFIGCFRLGARVGRKRLVPFEESPAPERRGLRWLAFRREEGGCGVVLRASVFRDERKMVEVESGFFDGEMPVVCRAMRAQSHRMKRKPLFDSTADFPKLLPRVSATDLRERSRIVQRYFQQQLLAFDLQRATSGECACRR